MKEAWELFERAHGLRPDLHAVLFNWAVSCADAAGMVEGRHRAEERPRLLEKAVSLYDQVAALGDRTEVAVLSVQQEASNNAATLLVEGAQEQSDPAARVAMLRQACERYAAANSLEDDSETMMNWGDGLCELSARLLEGGDAAGAEGAFNEGNWRFCGAHVLNDKDTDILINWSHRLIERAEALAEDRERARGLYVSALDRLGQALEINSADVDAMVVAAQTMHTLATSGVPEEDARRSLEEAGAMLARALQCSSSPQQTAEANGTFGDVLLEVARVQRAAGESGAVASLRQAVDRYSTAIACDPQGTGDLAHNLACAAALMGDEGRARQALLHAASRDALDVDSLAHDDDLVSLRDQGWFRQLCAGDVGAALAAE